jgi:uncharacterized protein (TIGR02448 family)
MMDKAQCLFGGGVSFKCVGLGVALAAFAAQASADDESVYYPTALTVVTSWGSYISSDATSSSERYASYEVREDAAAFVASDGEIRGPYLEMAISDIREFQPSMSEQDIARLLLVNAG